MDKKWLVDGLYPIRHIILMAGQPGNGKTWLVNQIAVDLACNTGYHLGLDAKPSYVISIDEDTPTDVFNSRIDRLAEGKGIKPDDLMLERISMTGFRLYDLTSRNLLVSKIKLHTGMGQNVVVIIDCLTKVMSGQNIDTMERASRVMSHLTDIRDAGATVFIIHHISTKKEVTIDKFEPNKLAGMILNSTVIVSACDTAFVIARIPIRDYLIFAIIPNERRMSLKVKNVFSVELREDEEKRWAYFVVLEETPHAATDHARKIFKMFADNGIVYTAKQLRIAMDESLSQTAIWEGLKELVSENCLTETINPNATSRKITYKRHPDYEHLTNFYKESL